MFHSTNKRTEAPGQGDLPRRHRQQGWHGTHSACLCRCHRRRAGQLLLRLLPAGLCAERVLVVLPSHSPMMSLGVCPCHGALGEDPTAGIHSWVFPSPESPSKRPTMCPLCTCHVGRICQQGGISEARLRVQPDSVWEAARGVTGGRGAPTRHTTRGSLLLKQPT